MNKKTFIYIFAGVIAAGVLCLVIGLIVHYSVSGSPVVTIVSLFALIAGGIMSGIGLISLLICLLLMVFGKAEKRQEAVGETSVAEEAPADNSGEEEAEETSEDVSANEEVAEEPENNQEE